MRPALAATGYQGSPAAACATGGIAIGDAFEAIRSGRAAMMLAGASESLSGNGAIWNMDALRLLSREQKDITKASCPFSRDRNGFVLAEGAAVLCLEEREAALARGATILGRSKGTAIFRRFRSYRAGGGSAGESENHTTGFRAGAARQS